MLFIGAGGSGLGDRKGKGVKRTSQRKRSRPSAEYATRTRQEYFQDEAEELEQAKRDRLTSLTSIMDLSANDYISMRYYISYDNERTADEPSFWTKEQELIFHEYYSTLTKYKVCEQKSLKFDKLMSDNYSEAAALITEKKGLRGLIEALFVWALALAFG